MNPGLKKYLKKNYLSSLISNSEINQPVVALLNLTSKIYFAEISSSLPSISMASFAVTPSALAVNF
jgi:hypothetical protein